MFSSCCKTHRDYEDFDVLFAVDLNLSFKRYECLILALFYQFSRSRQVHSYQSIFQLPCHATSNFQEQFHMTLYFAWLSVLKVLRRYTSHSKSFTKLGSCNQPRRFVLASICRGRRQGWSSGRGCRVAWFRRKRSILHLALHADQ
jgi:hypothetical protein